MHKDMSIFLNYCIGFLVRQECMVMGWAV